MRPCDPFLLPKKPPKQQRISRINTATSAYHSRVVANESWKVTRRRADLIDAFIVGIRDYRIAKDDANRQEVLLQWILEQLPLTELAQT